MQKTIWWIAIGVLACAARVEASPLWLKMGEVRDLHAAPEAVIRVGNRGIVRVIENGSKVRVIGLKPGVTAMTVDKTPYLVHVVRSSDKDFLRAMSETIGKMKGLRLHTDVQPLEVHGTLLRWRDWTDLAELSRTHAGEFRFRAQALPEAAEHALAHFQKLTRDRGLPVLRYTFDTGISVHVPAGAKGLKNLAAELFAPYGVKVQESSSQLLVQPLVRTQVVLAEVNRSQSRSFGVEWPSAYQAQVLPTADGSQSLMLTLKALEAKGEAQVLASPNLLCRSGSEARFHAGGEFPIRMISRAARDVVWKRHGVLLNVKPKADFAGALSIEIETEISLLDMAHAVDGIPALKSNRVHSHFDLIGKRTVALSGLIRQELGKSGEGLPLLTGLPILGPLFSSRSFRSEKSELIIFVTPEIQSPAEETQIEMPKGWVTNEW